MMIKDEILVLLDQLRRDIVRAYELAEHIDKLRASRNPIPKPGETDSN